MEDNLIDFSVLEDLSGGDPVYKYELLGIFLNSVEEGITNLEKLVNKGKDFDAIFKQAHALKSPAGIIKVKDMHPRMAKIEALGRAGTDMSEIKELFAKAMATHKEAYPHIVAEREKYKPAG